MKIDIFYPPTSATQFLHYFHGKSVSQREPPMHLSTFSNYIIYERILTQELFKVSEKVFFIFIMKLMHNPLIQSAENSKGQFKFRNFRVLFVDYVFWVAF